MRKWSLSVALVTLLLSGSAAYAAPADTRDFEHELLLLDGIFYHPSLLPVILQNVDYLELTPAQQQRLRDWRETNGPAMLAKMNEVVQGRLDFIDLSLDPDSSSEELVRQQQHLFKLQEQVLAYKLQCRKNILETFTQEQWQDLRFILAERQAVD